MFIKKSYVRCERKIHDQRNSRVSRSFRVFYQRSQHWIVSRHRISNRLARSSAKWWNRLRVDNWNAISLSSSYTSDFTRCDLLWFLCECEQISFIDIKTNDIYRSVYEDCFFSLCDVINRFDVLNLTFSFIKYHKLRKCFVID